jgi:DNA-directed RNA polymerase subunit RPC12/RpoP
MANNIVWLTIAEHRHTNMPAHFVIVRHRSKPDAEGYAEGNQNRARGIEVRVAGLPAGAGIDIRATGIVRSASGPAPRTGQPRETGHGYYCPRCDAHYGTDALTRTDARKGVRCPGCGTRHKPQRANPKRLRLTRGYIKSGFREDWGPVFTIKCLECGKKFDTQVKPMRELCAPFSDDVPRWACPKCGTAAYIRDIIGVKVWQERDYTGPQEGDP